MGKNPQVPSHSEMQSKATMQLSRWEARDREQSQLGREGTCGQTASDKYSQGAPNGEPQTIGPFPTNLRSWDKCQALPSLSLEHHQADAVTVSGVFLLLHTSLYF